ncbi:MAG: hypothetical protein HYW49_13770 [Deltaproteobacteria bacterium]|nr:hypothetical protein [Deltaproteobacteria bacterium]
MRSWRYCVLTLLFSIAASIGTEFVRAGEPCAAHLLRTHSLSQDDWGKLSLGQLKSMKNAYFNVNGIQFRFEVEAELQPRQRKFINILKKMSVDPKYFQKRAQVIWEYVERYTQQHNDREAQLPEEYRIKMDKYELFRRHLNAEWRDFDEKSVEVASFQIGMKDGRVHAALATSSETTLVTPDSLKKAIDGLVESKQIVWEEVSWIEFYHTHPRLNGELTTRPMNPTDQRSFEMFRQQLDQQVPWVDLRSIVVGKSEESLVIFYQDYTGNGGLQK